MCVCVYVCVCVCVCLCVTTYTVSLETSCISTARISVPKQHSSRAVRWKRKSVRNFLDFPQTLVSGDANVKTVKHSKPSHKVGS